MLLGQLHHQLFINVSCSVLFPSVRLLCRDSPAASHSVTSSAEQLSEVTHICPFYVASQCGTTLTVKYSSILFTRDPDAPPCRHRGPPTQVNPAGCSRSHQNIKILTLAAGAGKTGFFFSSPLILHREICTTTEALDGPQLRFEVTCLHYSFSRGPSPWRVFYTYWAHPTNCVYPLSLFLTN